ncbi:hypothetical protein ACIRP7_01545 [Streptomyces sp. NPDC102270]
MITRRRRLVPVPAALLLPGVAPVPAAPFVPGVAAVTGVVAVRHAA